MSGEAFNDLQEARIQALREGAPAESLLEATATAIGEYRQVLEAYLNAGLHVNGEELLAKTIATYADIEADMRLVLDKLERRAQR